jgi:hypothetical protein
MNVPGKLSTRHANPDFSGYRIIAAFEKKLEIADKPDEDIFGLFETMTLVEKVGTFQLILPPAEEIEGCITITALAPNGEFLNKKVFDKINLQDVNIQVEYKAAYDMGNPVPPPVPRFDGKVLDYAGKTDISKKQVLIWGRNLGAAKKEFRVIVNTKTDDKGYFQEELPYSEFEEAFATVEDFPEEKIPVFLENRRLPKKMILITGDESNKIKEESGESTCPGKKCFDFTTPNRALEEFNYYSIIRTTDPAIKGVTIEEGESLKPFTDIILNPDVLLKFTENLKTVNPEIKISVPEGIKISNLEIAKTSTEFFKSGSPEVTIIKEDGKKGLIEKPQVAVISAEPSILNTVESARRLVDIIKNEAIEISPVMPVEKIERVKNVTSILGRLIKKFPSRGNMNAANSVDWDDTPTFYQATTISHGHILNFKQIWKADGYSVGDILYSLPLAPRQKKQIAIVEWDRQETALRTETVTESESIRSSLSHDRDISEVAYGIVKESSAAHSDANTWSAGGGFGLALFPFVIGGGGGGGGASSNAWQNSSRSTSATYLNQLRDKTYQSASAVRSQRSTLVQSVGQNESVNVTTEVIGNPNHCHAVTIEYFEVLKHFQVLHELADVQECLFVPLLMSKFDREKALRWREPLLRFLRDRRLARTFDAMERRKNNYAGSDLPVGRYSQENVESVEGEIQIVLKLIRPDDKPDGNINELLWDLFEPFLWDKPKNIFDLYLSSSNDRNAVFQAKIAPRIAEAFVKELAYSFVKSDEGEDDLQLDSTLVSNYTPNVPLTVSIRTLGKLNPIRREDISKFKIYNNYKLPQYSKVLIKSATLRYNTRSISHYLFRNSTVNNDIYPDDPAIILTPTDSFEKRNPRNEDLEMEKKILAHLNEHLEYYHRIIWMSMDQNRRYMLLDGFYAPNSNSRSLASVVENRLIGIIGNSLVFPVAKGFNLDPTYNAIVPVKDQSGNVQKDANGEIIYEYKSLLDFYQPVTPIPPMRISVPTRGVYAESIMGRCNSCEDLDQSKTWVYNDPAFDLIPTAINPVGTESRRSDPGNLTVKDFPSPMINIQNAPEAPFSGLAPIMQLLGTPNLFKDITGLELNQKNALASLQAALNTSQFFAGEAVKIKLQEMMMNKIGTVKKEIQQALKDGLINEKQASELMIAALKSMIGEKKEEKGKTTENPTLNKILLKIGEQVITGLDITTKDEKIKISSEAGGKEKKEEE